MLMQTLDDGNAYLILVMDELEALIRRAGPDPLYSLTRIQESRLKAPQRLSLICILREPKWLGALDSSTRSTLQHNIIHLGEYSVPQLRDILDDRVALAFRSGTVSAQVVGFVAESSASEGGDARYAIELLWRAGKYADASGSPEVLPEHVRKAAVSIYSVLRKDVISSPGFHERLFLLGVARRFRQTGNAYISMGEAEEAYAVVCEEHSERRRGHTQLWKYVRDLSALGVIKTEISRVEPLGKTTLISLPRVPASDLERELSVTLYTKKE